MVELSYENRFSAPSELKYEYQVRVVADANLEAEQVTYDAREAASFTVNERHGVRVLFVQTGQLGVVSARQLFLSFVSGRFGGDGGGNLDI